VEFIAPEHRELVRQKIASGNEEPYEIIGVSKDGTLLDLEVRGRGYSYRDARCASLPYGTSPSARRSRSALSTKPSTMR
jgi:hypothetical protein